MPKNDTRQCAISAGFSRTRSENTVFSTFTLRALPNKSKLKSAGQTKQNYLHRSGNPYTRGCKNLQILPAAFINFQTKSQLLNSWVIRQLNLNHCKMKTVQVTTYKKKLKSPVFFFVLLSRTVKNQIHSAVLLECPFNIEILNFISP